MTNFGTKCLLLLFVTWTLLFLAQGIHVLIDKFKSTCPGYDDDPKMYVDDSKFFLVNHTTYLSHRFVVVKDIAKEIQIEMLPTRCNSKDALDTCETYRSYKLKNVCHFLISDKAPWSPFVKNYKPPVGCPIKKGTYTLTNGTLDPTALPQWAKSYWKVVTVLREQKTNAFILCTYIEFQIV